MEIMKWYMVGVKGCDISGKGRKKEKKKYVHDPDNLVGTVVLLRHGHQC